MRAPRPLRAALAALLGPAFLLGAAPAWANGRYPAAGLVVVDPNDPAHLVVRATYGVLSTSDAGGRWGWICEGAVGFGGYEDPMLAILEDGTIVGGLFKGLSASKTGGCDWEIAGGGLADKYVTDLSAERNDPSRAVLVVSNGMGAGTFLTQLWETADSGAAWTQAGVDLPSDFLALNVDVAPSDPARVYVSGRYGAPDYLGAIQRSPDRGSTWERFDIPGSDDTHLPYLSAVDPADPDVIYVRLDGDPTDVLLVSQDGGGSFDTMFTGEGNLLGFALSPDGGTVLVGGDRDGVWSAPASTLVFEKISDVGVKCLTWVESGVYACADEFVDGFTAGISDDEGRTFTPILHLGGVCGPLECAPGSDVQAICTELWGATQLTIGAEACDPTGSGPGSGPGGGTTPAPEAAGGCACRAPAARPTALAPLALASAGAAALAFRRRRARRAPPARRPAEPRA